MKKGLYQSVSIASTSMELEVEPKYAALQAWLQTECKVATIVFFMLGKQPRLLNRNFCRKPVSLPLLCES